MLQIDEEMEWDRIDRMIKCWILYESDTFL